jgi:hypothetical protein
MPTIAFAAPVIPGRTDLLRDSNQQASAGGSRHAAYLASRERAGITREMAWLQSAPMGDLTVVYIEADDLEAAFATLGSSQDPFDVWFREQTREIHGIDIEDGAPSPELLMHFEAVPTAS